MFGACFGLSWRGRLVIRSVSLLLIEPYDLALAGRHLSGHDMRVVDQPARCRRKSGRCVLVRVVHARFLWLVAGVTQSNRTTMPPTTVFR